MKPYTLAWQGPIAVRMAKLAISQGIEVSLRGQSRTALIYFWGGRGYFLFEFYLQTKRALQPVRQLQRSCKIVTSVSSKQ